MSTRKASSAVNRKMKLRDAARYLGISPATMSRLIARGFPHTLDPIDRRRKLVTVADLDRLKEQSLAGEPEDESESL
jgi:hypothetical protein